MMETVITMDETTSATEESARHQGLEIADPVVPSEPVAFPKTSQNVRPEEVGFRFLFAVVFVIAIKIWETKEPFPHAFYLPSASTNPTYDFPNFSDIVSPTVPLVFAFVVVPLVIIAGEILYNIYLRSCSQDQTIKKAFLRALALIFASIEASCLTIGFTDLTKMLVGEQRPNYAQEALADADAAKLDSVSFPSGHTSTSFNAAIFLFSYILLLSYRFRQVPTKPSSWWFRELRSLYLYLALLPVILAGVIGISRIVDYHHHFWDVIAGALYGGFFAAATFSSCIISNWEFYSLTGLNVRPESGAIPT